MDFLAVLLMMFENTIIEEIEVLWNCFIVDMQQNIGGIKLHK